MTSEPDNLARVIAVAALFLSAGQMLIASRRGVWRRRAANVPDLRVTLDELRVVLEGGSDARGAANLWTRAMDAHMVSLLEQVETVPDRRLALLARRIHDEVVAIRGMATPSDDDLMSNGVTLNSEQRQLLERACSDVRASRARIAKCIRKGGRSA